MGRSTSCFKIITCGSDSADRDDLQAPAAANAAENKGSSDKRGWSFRKRSARHRVLSNTVVSETPSSVNKESPESANLNFQPQDNSPVLEKVSMIQCTDEKPPLSASVDSKMAETIVATKDEGECNLLFEESVVIVIQAAIRGFLAQREILKLKNIVKVQAAVRGHLVRQHAVGTLRCVQAIVKMQALVRARRARLLVEGSYIDKQLDGKHYMAVSKTLEKENSAPKPIVKYTSIEKLLANSFARQLMEATPRKRPIHIKCDPLKPNSAWNWLERWMSVSSSGPVTLTPQPELKTEQLEGKRTEDSASAVETKVQSEGVSRSTDTEPNTLEILLPTESEENLITYNADNFKFQVSNPTLPSVGDDLGQPLPEKIGSSDVEETSINIYSLENLQLSISSPPHEAGRESEQPNQFKCSMKRLASEQLDSEGKKFLYGSRKPSNPSFIAAQSKFEELSSTTNSNKSFNSLSQDAGIDSNVDTFASGFDTVARTKELNMSENSGPYNLRLQYGGSECGTELSISSTLDSPDISEGAAGEYKHEAKVSEQETCNPERTKEKDIGAKDVLNDPETSINPALDLSDPLTSQPDKLDSAKGESLTSTIGADIPHRELKPERSTSDIQREVISEAGGPTNRSSPEASPRSHITVPESQETPSSVVSVKAKVKSGSSQKRKSLSAGKRSPSNQNHDSGARSSVEQLPKDQKSGKRRNSFGSARPDSTDQEPRASSSSSSLPHFMQATESARAKVQANNSPRSSPDVQERDFTKKRHSLPGANGRQGSPRIQRSMSQAQQGARGNGSQAVHEKKWQR